MIVKIKNLSRIQQVQWIKSSFNAAHYIDSFRAKFLAQRCFLSHTYPMFASTRSVPLNRTTDHVVNNIVDAFALLGIMLVEENGAMEISITDMAKYASKNTKAVEITF